MLVSVEFFDGILLGSDDVFDLWVWVFDFKGVDVYFIVLFIWLMFFKDMLDDKVKVVCDLVEYCFMEG